jgi:hypothetical protein
MAFLVYGLMTSSGGPYWTSSDVTNITGANPAPGVNVYDFVTGDQRARFFTSSNALGPAGPVALPTLVNPNSVPIGAVQIGTSAIWFVQAQAGIPDPSGFGFTALTGGQLFFAVQFAAGSPDAGSPGQFLVDPYTLILVASTTAELP